MNSPTADGKTPITRTIDGDSVMLSWNDGEYFNALIQPRIVNSDDIHKALLEAVKNDPHLIIGSFKGWTFHD